MRSSQITIGLIGCGAIGTRIAQAIDQGEIDVVLSGIVDSAPDRAEGLKKRLRQQHPQVFDINDIFDDVDLVIEAASAAVVQGLLLLAIEHKTDCMFMSTGGLLGQEENLGKACSAGIKIYCPSGAVAGLDAVAAASAGRIDKVILTTVKPPKGLKGAPYILENNIDLEGLSAEKVLFEGNALEAVKAFPQNINVAASLSLAGIGPEKTLVRIIADPDAKRNSHQIEAEGEFGRLLTRTENLPSPFNPRTSYLAALSAISCLKNITRCLKIGG